MPMRWLAFRLTAIIRFRRWKRLFGKLSLRLSGGSYWGSMMSQVHYVRARGRLFACLLFLGAGSPAGATGFFINQQGVKDLGRVGAGSAAMGDDLATIWFNPAGLTQIWGDGEKRTQVAIGLHLIVPRSDLRDAGSTSMTLGTVGTSVPRLGRDASNPTDPTPIPNLYWARELV